MGRSRSLRLIVTVSVLAATLAGGVAGAGASESSATYGTESALLAGRWGATLDPRLDIEGVHGLQSPAGNLCLNLMPRGPWEEGMPPNFFSWFVQASIHPMGVMRGVQRHAGQWEKYSENQGGPAAPGEWRGMSDGSLVVDTGVPLDSAPTIEVGVDSGHLTTEDAQFQSSFRLFSFASSDIMPVDDCFSYDGIHAVFDPGTGTPVETTPEVTETTQAATVTETTQAATVTETTQAATVTETTQAATVTATTQAVVGSGEVTTTTRPRTVTRETRPTSKGETCWWCWGIIALFLVVLLCILYIWLKTYEWWTCWLPWFIVIFIWVPFLLAGMWWWRPAWWWVPLLAWFPIIGGYTWFWARRRSWWQPWHLYVVAGYLGALILGMFLVGDPEWGLLFPLFWVPWVGVYLWFRGARRPWFRPWMWLLSAGFVGWIFLWVVSLSPWWAWWLPVVFFPFAGWWFFTHGYRWREIHGPKWCWIVPFSFLPFFAWWIPLWGPWWCYVIILFLALTLFCAIFNHFKEEEWWTCWIPWFLIIWVGIPFLLAGLWFFQPNWWWLPLLGWFGVITAYTWWWARHRTWWQPWHWYVVLGYLAVAAVLMIVVGSPTWGLLFPIFWLVPVVFYLWYRPRRQPWFQPWMWLLFAGYVAWVFIWVIWLTPFWGWWFPVFFFPFFGWWGFNHGYEEDVWIDKSCALIPMAVLPWLGYMLAIYCIPEYYM